MLTREENELIARTGPGTPMGELWRRFWVPAFMSWELPEPDCPPVRIRLLGEDLVGFRDTAGKVGLFAANCPHRGASLFFGRNEENGLRCVYHGWKFDVTGQCVDMPNEPPESNFKHKIRATAYPCQERGGIVWTYMGPNPSLRPGSGQAVGSGNSVPGSGQAVGSGNSVPGSGSSVPGSGNSVPELPDLAWTLLPEEHRYVLKFHVECNYLQATEGDIDNSHVPFAHGSLDPNASLPFLDRLRRTRLAFRGQGETSFYVKDLHPRGIIVEKDYGILMGWRRDLGDRYSWHINHWFMPHSTVMGSAPPGSLLSNLRVPMDDENSWQFRIRWNPYRPLDEEEAHSYREDGRFFPRLIPGTFRCEENIDNDYLIDRELQRTSSVTGIRSQTQQDRAVNETMGRIYDRRKEHLGTADAVIIAMRRRMLRAARALADGVEPYGASHGDVYQAIPVDLELAKEIPFEEGAHEWITGQRAVALAR